MGYNINREFLFLFFRINNLFDFLFLFLFFVFRINFIRVSFHKLKII